MWQTSTFRTTTTRQLAVYTRQGEDVGCETTYARGVPATNSLGAADVGELRDLALRLPPVLGDQAVGAVRAGHGREGATAVIVPGVIGD
jgi:hypothetical protein